MEDEAEEEEDTSRPNGTDTGPPVDTGPPPDTGEPPPPTVCLPATATGYRLPSTRWALSALFASRRLAEPTGNQLVVSPAWFLASAWQADAFSCGGYGAPWSNEAHTEEGGCYELGGPTHWAEVERLFPEQFPSTGWPDWVTGDTPERSTLTLAHALYAGHILLRRVDGTDPDTWLAGAADPAAAPRLAALFHVEGPWSAAAAQAVTECTADLLACTEGDTRHHVEGVEARLALLDGVDCYAEPITDADIDGFIEGIQGLWPHADWVAIAASARDARTTGTFPVDGLAVIQAIEASLNSPLTCPEDAFWDHYRYSCL